MIATVFGWIALVLSPTATQIAGAKASDRAVRVPPDASAKDIVVTGYRQRKSQDRRAALPPGVNSSGNRVTYEHSARLAKCVVRGRSKLGDLRVVLDGEVGSARQRGAQHRLVQRFVTCSLSPTLLTFTMGSNSPQDHLPTGTALAGDSTGMGLGPTINPLGGSLYDRGAIVIATLKQFAPDLTLTRAELNVPEVQRRYYLREIPRNRLRSGLDQTYFGVATCMVREAPELAISLVYSDGPARMGDVQEALIDRTGNCVGNPRRVKVDPTQFRIYIADALYRWVVAARDIASLVPGDKMAANAS